MNCTNLICRVETSEKIELDENGNPNSFSCNSWDNLEMIGRKLVRGYTNSL